MSNAHLAETIAIAVAYISRGNASLAELPSVLAASHAAVSGLVNPPVVAEPVPTLTPAVPVKKSVTADYIVCLEDGKKLKMLKRHLAVHYNLTPAEYRAKWGLPSYYPMVAANYAKQRSELAVKLGLGQGSTGRPRLVKAA